MPLKFNV